jgi:Acyl-CoA reductase (LuxC)
MYSWALGFLSGNLNVVRLSSRYKNLEGVFFEYLKNLNQNFPILEKRNVFLKYSHDQVDITKKISQISSARMIWGGDKTIQKIRSIESNVFCRDVVFSDRFSGAVFKADSILNLEHKALEDLITKFFQDTMEFDQMGCSSPRFIGWVFNDEKNLKFAKEKFWQYFKDYAQKNFQDQTSFAIDRLSTQINLIANDQSKDLSYDFPTRVNVLKLNNFLRQEHCGKCLFYEIDLKNLNDLCDQLTPQDQTLVQFGFNDEELKNFTSNLGWSSLSRIVNLGEALKFSHIWDGYNIYNELTTFNPI